MKQLNLINKITSTITISIAPTVKKKEIHLKQNLLKNGMHLSSKMIFIWISSIGVIMIA